MNNSKEKSFFWVSYTDLMTTLFFVMLVLYVLTFIKLRYEQERYKVKVEEKVEELDKLRYEQEMYKVKAEELDKIREIEKSINNIDSTYFKYNTEYKKHILNINVKYKSESTNINDINQSNRTKLVNAGNSIKNLIGKLKHEDNIKYLVIIEGQASKLGEQDYNYNLSYQRALSLIAFWKYNSIDLDDLKNCELIIAGSGEKGLPRDIENDRNNQRFLIHIIPKIGKIGK